MTSDRAGLRLRLFAIVLAATLVPAAPVTIALLLQIRDALYARKVADSREALERGAARAATCRDLACAVSFAAGVGAIAREGSCPRRTVRAADGTLLLCEPVASLGVLELRVDLVPVRDQIGALDRRVLALVAAFALAIVVVGGWLLDRGVVRRLAKVDDALEAVGAEHEAELLPEGGDAVGRVGAAVNRLSERLREERQRTRAQIGELEEKNREIRAAREEVARSERLASVGRLASGVAHEVGNPVSAVIAYAALMRDGLAAGKDVGDFATRIEREAGRIDRILRDLLDLARPREVRLAPVELETAVAAARTAVDSVQVQVAARLPSVVAEEHYLAQLFVNLLTNAARAGARRVRLSARLDGPDVLVDVEDDGAGIPAEALARLFEPFFTTAAPGQGTGLGLALCHATMERFGGSISARNREGVPGAIFTLRFRRA